MFPVNTAYKQHWVARQGTPEVCVGKICKSIHGDLRNTNKEISHNGSAIDGVTIQVRGEGVQDIDCVLQQKENVLANNVAKGAFGQRHPHIAKAIGGAAAVVAFAGLLGVEVLAVVVQGIARCVGTVKNPFVGGFLVMVGAIGGAIAAVPMAPCNAFYDAGRTYYSVQEKLGVPDASEKLKNFKINFGDKWTSFHDISEDGKEIGYF